jgi:ADP-ribose pyrophosphatase YjhB (NUDIX family)
VSADDPPRREQRVAAYGLLVADDKVLLVKGAAESDVPGRWFLPGGGVEHGEEPTETVRREFVEETGLDVNVGELLGVWSEMIEASVRGVEVHSVSIVYEIESWRGDLEPAHERVSWELVGADDEARMDFVRAVLRAQDVP